MLTVNQAIMHVLLVIFMLAHFVSTGPLKLSYCRPCKRLSIAIIPTLSSSIVKIMSPKQAPAPAPADRPSSFIQSFCCYPTIRQLLLKSKLLGLSFIGYSPIYRINELSHSKYLVQEAGRWVRIWYDIYDLNLWFITWLRISMTKKSHIAFEMLRTRNWLNPRSSPHES